VGPIELGLGALEVLSEPGAGSVVGVYPKAAYLRLPAGLFALTSFDVPAGPGHARSTAGIDGMRLEDRVIVTRSLLQAGPVLIDLEHPRVWRGPLPTPAELKSGGRLALDLLEGVSAPALDRAVAESAAEQLKLGDIAGVAGRLGGVGPGLTPAGDDCLAGIFLIAKIRGGEAASPMLEDAAAKVETNDIARMFLHWAARGQSIEPVHRFLVLAVEGDAKGTATALNDLISFGHSSGADLALGLRLGLELLPAPQLPIET
jgi:hypothetical protein